MCGELVKTSFLGVWIVSFGQLSVVLGKVEEFQLRKTFVNLIRLKTLYKSPVQELTHLNILLFLVENNTFSQKNLLNVFRIEKSF
jgi:hypothetical protein